MRRAIVWSYLTLAVALAGYASAENARSAGAAADVRCGESPTKP